MNQKNDKNSNTHYENMDSIHNEITQYLQKHAKESFAQEKKDQDFSLFKKSYEKYFPKGQENIESLDIERIEEECLSLESEIDHKCNEIEEHEKKIKSLFLGSGVYDDILSEEILSKSESDKNSEILLNRARLSEERINILRSQSPRSTRKIFIDFLNQDDSQVKIFKENLQVELKENLRLKNVHNEKFSNLEKKRMIYEENLTKVTLKENNLKDLKEKLFKMGQHNEVGNEEIRSLDLNISQGDQKIKFLQSQIQIKKPQNQIENDVSKVKKSLYCLKLDHESHDISNLSNKKLMSENFTYQREIENNQMILEDYYNLTQKKKENSAIINEKRCNILSMMGIMMNCLSLMKKSGREKKTVEDSKKKLGEKEAIFKSLEEVKKFETEIYDSAEKLRILNEAFTKLRASRTKKNKIFFNSNSNIN